MELLELYYDVLIKILEEVEPEDLAALAQTSIGFNQFVKGNERLHKAHYLKNFVSSTIEILGMQLWLLIQDRIIPVEDQQIQSRTGSQSCSDLSSAG